MEARIKLMDLQSGNRFFFWSRRGVGGNKVSFTFDAFGPLSDSVYCLRLERDGMLRVVGRI